MESVGCCKAVNFWHSLDELPGYTSLELNTTLQKKGKRAKHRNLHESRAQKCASTLLSTVLTNTNARKFTHVQLWQDAYHTLLSPPGLYPTLFQMPAIESQTTKNNTNSSCSTNRQTTHRQASALNAALATTAQLKAGWRARRVTWLGGISSPLMFTFGPSSGNEEL